MKNKEIEEILNYMKQYVENKYEHDSEPMLNYKDLQIVLSHIEQLENKYESLLEDRKQLLNLVKQLENNRDKAIEFLKTEHMTYDSAWEWRQALINILKGDSDE